MVTAALAAWDLSSDSDRGKEDQVGEQKQRRTHKKLQRRWSGTFVNDAVWRPASAGPGAQKQATKQADPETSRLMGLLQSAGAAIKKLQEENRSLRDENDALRSKMAADDVNVAVDAALVQNNVLRRRVDVLKKSAVKVDQLKLEVAELKSENALAVDQIAKLRLQLQDSKEQQQSKHGVPSPMLSSRVKRTYAPPPSMDETASASIQAKILDLGLPLSRINNCTYELPNSKKLTLSSNPDGTVFVRTGGGKEEVTSYLSRRNVTPRTTPRNPSPRRRASNSSSSRS